jgi:hypothetical protein
MSDTGHQAFGMETMTTFSSSAVSSGVNGVHADRAFDNSSAHLLSFLNLQSFSSLKFTNLKDW